MERHEKKTERWKPCQFSLRSLLLLMLVVSAFFGGWVTNELRRKWERAHFIQTFEQIESEHPPLLDEGPLFSLPTKELWKQIATE